MSIFCPFCGEKLVDDAKFCKSCGKNVENYHARFNNDSNNYTHHPPVAEKSHTLATVLGFICSVLFPLLGFIFGIYMLTRKDSSNARKYGILMIIVSIIFWIINFFSLLRFY